MPQVKRAARRLRKDDQDLFGGDKKKSLWWYHRQEGQTIEKTAAPVMNIRSPKFNKASM